MQIDEKGLAVGAQAIADERIRHFGSAAGLSPREVEYDYARVAITAYLQALRPVSTGETEGWVLVPVEPSFEMCNAGWREIGKQGFQAEDAEVAPIYRAMLAAAGGNT